ncbi:MAG: baseplate J/gp47 family protein [Halobacteriales archaeon]|nr:baseplate J/gp47 family protein [Halobacteriales archaeon]
MPISIPDPPFGTETEDSIRDRMFTNMDSGLDQAQGSMAWNLISPLAIEVAKLWAALDEVVEYGFAQTAYGKFLDARAEEHGVTRKGAAPATGTVRFNGTNGTVIAAGTQVSNTVLAGSVEEPQVFETDSGGTISGGFVDLAVTAITDGADGNLPANAIDRLVTIIAGVTSVDNAAATTGGVDEETDDELRDRLLAAVAAREGAGTPDDYETWAMEVEGVGAATAEPVWAGAGTVRVMILDSNLDPASAGLQTDVADYLETKRPIGASVTVDTPSIVTHAISATLTMESGFTVAGVQSAVEAAIQAYYDTLSTGDDVIYNEVGAAIVQTQGVADYSSLLVNGGSTNVTVSGTEKAEMGTVTLS